MRWSQSRTSNFSQCLKLSGQIYATPGVLIRHNITITYRWMYSREAKQLAPKFRLKTKWEANITASAVMKSGIAPGKTWRHTATWKLLHVSTLAPKTGSQQSAHYITMHLYEYYMEPIYIQQRGQFSNQVQKKVNWLCLHHSTKTYRCTIHTSTSQFVTKEATKHGYTKYYTNHWNVTYLYESYSNASISIITAIKVTLSHVEIGIITDILLRILQLTRSTCTPYSSVMPSQYWLTPGWLIGKWQCMYNIPSPTIHGSTGGCIESSDVTASASCNNS